MSGAGVPLVRAAGHGDDHLRVPQKAFVGLSGGRSWSHFVGICRQKLSKSSKIDF